MGAAKPHPRVGYVYPPKPEAREPMVEVPDVPFSPDADAPEELPAAGVTCTVAPPSRVLTGHAAALWDHYYPALLCKYNDVDLFMLEEYCYVSKCLREKQDILDAAGAFVQTALGVKPHPLVSVTNKWAADKRRLESELGIGTHTKKRINRLDKGTTDGKEANPIVGEYDS